MTADLKNIQPPLPPPYLDLKLVTMIMVKGICMEWQESLCRVECREWFRMMWRAWGWRGCVVYMKVRLVMGWLDASCVWSIVLLLGRMSTKKKRNEPNIICRKKKKKIRPSNWKKGARSHCQDPSQQELQQNQLLLAKHTVPNVQSWVEKQLNGIQKKKK